jgi:N-acetyl sugar amidotransferase|tara:strand:+ start:735 stop:1907 length:1173 start_codon:yes stop_codon:yes gene_type:complete
MKKKFIRYCRKCILPETKPDLHIDEEGICSACRYYEQREDIDWKLRKEGLLTILDKYRSKDGSYYDCIVPSSGGKDSTYITVKMLEYGMNPLCVTATTDKLSKIGRRNIENIKNLGVDYIEITTNPKIRRKINRLTLRKIGDISWPEHLTIFTIPVRIAVQFNVPLIVWGENSQNENGGPAAMANDNILDRRWLEEFGGLLGFRVADLLGQEDIENKHIIPYTYPSDGDMKRVGVTGLFLGYYIPWDGHNNALIAQIYGLETYPRAIEGSIINYENLDNLQMRIHDYFKFLKYGYDRATDWACLHIRRERLSRDEALNIVEKHGGKFPWSYLGCRLEEILQEIDVSLEEFVNICDQFTNKRLFMTVSKGNLRKDKYGNLTKINNDNIEDN